MTKDERREAMPETTKLVDEYRKVFGELNAIKADENGRKIEWRRRMKTS